jgi:hypothetical protein
VSIFMSCLCLLSHVSFCSRDLLYVSSEPYATISCYFFDLGMRGGDQIATPSCSVCQFDFIDSSSVSVICDSRNLLLLQINNMWLVSAADCFVFFVLFFYLL